MKRWIPLVIVLLAAAVVPARLVQVRMGKQMAILASENNRLRQRVADLSRASGPPASPSAPARPETTRVPRAAKPAGNPEDAIAIQRLKLALTDANASIDRLQMRAERAEAQVQNLNVDNRRLASSEADLQESLSAANQAIDALQKELKGGRDHVTQVEIAYQKLRDQSGADTRKLAEIQQLAAELQDIHKRRETYLNSILRRYRQITEQYRSLSGVLQAQRTEAPGAGSADLARIQDSIAMAEEDLRQLYNLNAAALLVQKRMAGK